MAQSWTTHFVFKNSDGKFSSIYKKFMTFLRDFDKISRILCTDLQRFKEYYLLALDCRSKSGSCPPQRNAVKNFDIIY